MLLPILLLLAQAASPPQPQEPPATPAGAPLSLTEALTLARARSPLTAAARARAEGAVNAAQVAGRLADPDLELAMENWRPGASDFDAGRDLDVFAVLVQPLDLFTRGGRKAQAAGERDQAEAESRRSIQELDLEVVRAYLEALRGRELESVHASQADQIRSIVTAMHRRVEEGYAAEADLLRFRAESARIETQLVRARIERDRAEAALAVLVGGPVASRLLMSPPIPVPPDDDPAVFAERSLEHRPDVAAARARAAAAQGGFALEHGRRLPDLALSGGYKRTGGLDTGVLGVTTSLPVFERNRRARARAQAEARAAELELAGVTERARAEGEVLLRAARELSQRLARMDEELIRPAAAARRAALAAFREGAADVLRVVDAERLYSEATREALDLTVEAFVAIGRARLAAGEEVLP